MDKAHKISLLEEFDVRLGNDFDVLTGSCQLEKEIQTENLRLEHSLNKSSAKLKQQITAVLEKAEKDTNEVDELQKEHNKFCDKVDVIMTKTEPLRKDLETRINIVNTLDDVMFYLKSFEHITSISEQLDKSDDDENSVSLYVELKKYCDIYTMGHRGQYVADLTNHYNLVLRYKFGVQYDELLKAIKWPFTSGSPNMSPPKDIITKFNIITKYLLLTEIPESFREPLKNINDREACMPVKILLHPLKKRFSFHFMTTRQTARLDRPEWFLTQTLTWIKDHGPFLRKYVQPIADKLKMNQINVEREFYVGLLTLAANRLTDVMEMHCASETHGNNIDASFAHCVDETLGFQKELNAITGMDINSVLSVLTKAQHIVKWLAVEKKYALAKMEEALSSPSWMEPIAAGVGVAVGSALWVPRAADWFATMLKTIEERYALLPQPGHKLQFLELQQELLEEWRVRLMQLLTAAQATVCENTFTGPDTGPHPLTAVINCAHNTRLVLLQWAHSLMYLQLFYYRRQFNDFTKQQHADENPTESISSTTETEDPALSLEQMEKRANKLAEDASDSIMRMVKEDTANRRKPVVHEDTIWGDAPDLLMRLRDIGLYTISDHIVLEFKAAIKEYKNQKWHSMLVSEEMALSVSPSLCRPLAGLCARLHSLTSKLPPSLCVHVRSQVASMIDGCLFDEMILGHWWNNGGVIQLSHDVHKNIVPVFTLPSELAIAFPLPKLVNSCTLFNLDYDDARRLRNTLQKGCRDSKEDLLRQHVTTINLEDALNVLNRRIDLSTHVAPPARHFLHEAAESERPIEEQAAPGL